MLRLGSRSQAIGARREKTRRHKIQKWEEDCLSWHKTGTACENSSVAQSKTSQGTLKSRSESALVIQCTSKEIIQQLNSEIMVQTQYSIWHIMMIFHVINALCLLRLSSSPSRQSLFHEWFSSTCTVWMAPWMASQSTHCPTLISATSLLAPHPPPPSSLESLCAGQIDSLNLDLPGFPFKSLSPAD